MRSRKNSQSDSANYYGTNQITSIANQQANWLIPDSDGLSQNLNLNNENHRHGSIVSDIERGGRAKPLESLYGFSLQGMITIVLGGLIAIFILIAAIIVAIHRVQEGHVGLYYKNGALLDSLSGPGIHWLQPFVTDVVELRITPETKTLDPMVCTTRDGVKNVFRDVQVITSIDIDHVLSLVRRYTSNPKQMLVYDRVRQAIQDFCSNHSIDEVYNTQFLDMVGYVQNSVTTSIERFAPDAVPAIKLWNVFLPKPDVPPAIAANYRQVKIEWTEQLVAKQKQITEEILKETERQKAIADANRLKAVQAIKIAQDIEKEEGLANITKINNKIHEEKEKLYADVSSYVAASEAKSNEGLLTDNYVRLETAKMMLNSTKMYFSGSDSVIGGILSKAFAN